jgi:two-component system CheB/CheR fusion protein
LRQTLRTTASNSEFVDLFEGRLAALAHAHTLLIESRWEGAELGHLVSTQLAAYIRDEGIQRLQLHGEPIMLSPDIATPLGLVLHELATNAAKYGALSSPKGKVDLDWTVRQEKKQQILKIIWRESEGPEVVLPNRVGFGGSLIERSLPGASVRREFLPEGLICTIEIDIARRPKSDVES